MRSIFALTAIAATVAAQANNTLVSTLQGNPDLSVLLSLVSANTALASALSSATNLTILAPSNSAFEKLLGGSVNSSTANATLSNNALVQAILSYHVLNGTYNSTALNASASFIPTHLTNTAYANVTGGQRVEATNSTGNITFLSGLLTTSNVTTADVTYNNGVVHVIDTVLAPPSNISATAVQLGLSAAAGALTNASLVSTLDGLTDVTVFVPNNTAFQNIASVLANATTEQLVSVLGYHVVNGSVLYSTNITNGSVATLNGANLTTTVANGSVFVNQAKVVIPNVLVANGVVHVIDSVLNPNNTSAAPGSESTPAFSGASSATDVPFTSGIPAPTSSVSVPAQATSTAAGGSSTNAAARPAQAMATGIVGGAVMLAGALIAL